MITATQKQWKQDSGWKDIGGTVSNTPQLVFLFASRTLLENPHSYHEVKTMFPQSHIISCSTSGEILKDTVSDDSLSVTALHFDKTHFQFSTALINNSSESKAVGTALARAIPHEGLVHVLVFSDGQHVNGTALVKGLTEVLPANVTVTGGLVGDGANFQKTLLGFDEVPKEKNVLIIAFYSDSLKIGYGCLGGWDPFGIERTITKSAENVLYELDGKPALSLYKQYLGDRASELPGSGLLFPLQVKTMDHGKESIVIRTLLSVNESAQSMTFAGDMPQGSKAQLMKANFDRLVEGAARAGDMSVSHLDDKKAEFALLVSCVGRKLVLKDRADEEIEAVRKVVGEDATIAGFYSYGEICPTSPTENQCQLHNQTMTITIFREDD